MQVFGAQKRALLAHPDNTRIMAQAGDWLALATRL
jgi:hypothetical protein